MLDAYMRETDAMNVTLPNSSVVYRYEGINAERINEIDMVEDFGTVLFLNFGFFDFLKNFSQIITIFKIKITTFKI